MCNSIQLQEIQTDRHREMQLFNERLQLAQIQNTRSKAAAAAAAAASKSKQKPPQRAAAITAAAISVRCSPSSTALSSLNLSFPALFSRLFSLTLSFQASAASQKANPIPRKMAGGQGSGSRHKICEHKCRRTMCRECGGQSLCMHGNQRNHCPACRKEGIGKKGKTYLSFCQHNRQKSRCVQCKGVGICEHGRERYRCSLCKAKQVS